MEKHINVNVTENAQVIEILQGEALPRREPKRVIINGLINAPFEFLSKRLPNPETTHLIVDLSEGKLELVVDEKNHYSDVIAGKLELNPAFEKFGINEGVSRDTFELADFIKMNRFFFADRNVAMKLVSDLKNFKAKVNKQIEQSNNDRGNTRLLHDQAVDSNIPESFDLVIPIFKGQAVMKFSVEINIDARSFECTLISPDANDLINEVKENLINEQVENIKGLVPGLAILEV